MSHHNLSTIQQSGTQHRNKSSLPQSIQHKSSTVHNSGDAFGGVRLLVDSRFPFLHVAKLEAFPSPAGLFAILERTPDKETVVDAFLLGISIFAHQHNGVSSLGPNHTPFDEYQTIIRNAYIGEGSGA